MENIKGHIKITSNLGLKHSILSQVKRIEELIPGQMSFFSPSEGIE